MRWLVVFILLCLAPALAQPPYAPQIAPADPVAAVAAAPDGLSVAISYVNGLVVLRDVNSSHIQGVLHMPFGSAGPLAFSPDGRYLAVSGRRGDASVWNLASETQVALLPFVADRTLPTHLAFSPDSHDLMAWSYDEDMGGSGSVWSIPQGRLVRCWVQAAGLWLPDGAIGLLHQGRIDIFNPHDGCWTRRLTGLPQPLVNFSESADAHWLALLAAPSAERSTGVLVDLSRVKIVRRLTDLPNWDEMAITADGQYVLGTARGAGTTLWNTHHGIHFEVPSTCEHLAMLSGARWILADGGSLDLWDVDKGLIGSQTVGSPVSALLHLDADSNGRYLLASDGGNAWMLDLHTGTSTELGDVGSPALSGDGHRLLTCEGSELTSERISDAHVDWRLGRGYRLAASSPDGRYIATVADDKGGNGQLQLWTASGLEGTARVGQATGIFLTLTVVLGALVIIVTGRIKPAQAVLGILGVLAAVVSLPFAEPYLLARVPHSERELPGIVQSVTFAADGRHLLLVSSMLAATPTVLSVPDLRTVSLQAPPAGPYPRVVAFDPSGQTVWALQSETLQHWDLSSGHLVQPAPESAVAAGETLQISPDGGRAVILDEGEVAAAVVDLSTGAVVQAFAASAPRAAAWVSGGQVVALAAGDGEVAFYDAAGGRWLAGWCPTYHVVWDTQGVACNLDGSPPVAGRSAVDVLQALNGPFDASRCLFPAYGGNFQAARQGSQAMTRHDWATAIAAYRRLVRQVPAWPEGWRSLARAYRSERHFDDAIEALNDGLEWAPDDVELHADRAYTQVRRHDRAAAQRDLEWVSAHVLAVR